MRKKERKSEWIQENSRLNQKYNAYVHMRAYEKSDKINQQRGPNKRDRKRQREREREMAKRKFSLFLRYRNPYRSIFCVYIPLSLSQYGLSKSFVLVRKKERENWCGNPVLWCPMLFHIHKFFCNAVCCFQFRYFIFFFISSKINNALVFAHRHIPWHENIKIKNLHETSEFIKLKFNAMWK